MNIETHEDGSRTIGWTPRDTWDWATTPAARWPSSECAARYVRVELTPAGDIDDIEGWDENQQRIDGFSPNENEIRAMVKDALATLTGWESIQD